MLMTNLTKPLAKYIDHTNLKPNATKADIEQLCEEAKTYHFASVCVNPTWVKLASELLADSDVNVCTVIGFPLGATSTFSKVLESKQAILDGADELDMVQNVGELLSGNEEAVYEDVKAVADAVHENGKVLKVILENCLLTKDQIKRSSELAMKAKADFVKTSTGFSTGGATPEDVKLMKEVVGDHLQVKAAGGIHTKEEALAMIKNGADRIGASAGIEIVKAD